MRSFLFLLAALPAGFLPVSYVTMCIYVFANAVFDSGRPFAPPERSVLWCVVELSVYATVIQLPIYLTWAILSRRTHYRAKLTWVVILLLLNMFAIPWFLYRKYVGRLWPPLDSHPQQKVASGRWHQFSLSYILLVVTLIGCFLLPIRTIVHLVVSLDSVTHSARLTSSGTVEWGGDTIPIPALFQELKRTQHRLSTRGFRSRVVIEYYNDVHADDVQTVKNMCRDAGFHEIELEHLRWRSPERSESPE